MKRLFRSRSADDDPADEPSYDHDNPDLYEASSLAGDSGFDGMVSGDPDVESAQDATREQRVGAPAPERPGASAPPPIRRSAAPTYPTDPGHLDGDQADEGDGSPDFDPDDDLHPALEDDLLEDVSVEGFDDDYDHEYDDDYAVSRKEYDRTGEQRSAWAYIGLLGGLFCGLIIFGYACSDQRPGDNSANNAVELVGGAAPSRLVFRVDGDVISVQGSVPDEAAREQLLGAAQQAYGAENVVDELIVDDGTTLESGTVRFVGAATFGDQRPEELHELVGTSFGLANRGFEVGSVQTVRSPVSAEIAVAGGSITLVGELPDEQSVSDVLAIADEIWGQANIDGVGLSVGETTWTDGTIRATGSVTSADDRIDEFERRVKGEIDTLVNVDTANLTVIDNTLLVAQVQTTVDELVTTNPIQFAPTSPAIDPASDQLLVDVAAALNQIPDVPFEVVGHTDNVGAEDANLLLSQQRAQAIVERLTELGVDPARMTSRGEGEANPIADNATTEGKAANRRIEFVLIGTSGSVDEGESDG